MVEDRSELGSAPRVIEQRPISFSPDKDTEVIRDLREKFSRPDEPLFQTFERIGKGNWWTLAGEFNVSPRFLARIVNKDTVQFANEQGLLPLPDERQQRALEACYLNYPHISSAELASVFSVSRGRAWQIKEDGLRNVRRKILREISSEVSSSKPSKDIELENREAIPDFYILKPAMPAWFREIDLLGLSKELRSSLVDGGLGEISKADNASLRDLRALGIHFLEMPQLRSRIDEFARTLREFEPEREGQEDEESLNNKAVAEGKVPPFFFDRRLKDHWSFHEIDLLRLPVKERNTLKRAGLVGLREVDEKSDADLRVIRNLGEIGVRKIRESLGEFKWQRLGIAS